MKFLWRGAQMLVSMLRAVWFFELAGATLIVAGVAILSSAGWALVTSGALCLVKAVDLELGR